MSKLGSVAGTLGLHGMFHRIDRMDFNVATGGTVSSVGKYKVHTFTSTGTFTISKLATYTGHKTLYYCIVGGGAGGRGLTRGGAGGGVRLGNIASPGLSYSITAVGAGGAVNGSGGTTTFNGLSATGGGSTLSGTPGPGGFTYGNTLTVSGATVYGGGGGAGGKGVDGYLWNDVPNWPACGQGGAGVDFTMPDGTVVGTFGYGGGGGSGSAGSYTVYVWPPYWDPSSYGIYGSGGSAGMVSSTDPQMGVNAYSAGPGYQGAVLIAYRVSP